MITLDMIVFIHNYEVTDFGGFGKKSAVSRNLVAIASFSLASVNDDVDPTVPPVLHEPRRLGQSKRRDRIDDGPTPCL